MKTRIPEAQKQELLARHAEQGELIRARLAEYRAVPRERYFYELCYCLLTPQSKAIHCDAVAKELEARHFLESPFDPRPLLHPGNTDLYVRFHNTKSERLLRLREDFPLLVHLLNQPDDKTTRTQLAHRVSGLGMKEASHFLRNIGRTGVTIVDRHILKNLVRIGLLVEWPKSISEQNYLRIEALFEDLAEELGIPADELDLVLWSRETGMVLR